MSARTMLQAAGPMVRPMEWADVEAARATRRKPAAVRFTREPDATMREARKALGLELRPVDARLPSNLAPHVEALLSADQRAGLTRARAQKQRVKAMKACPCRLCALALNPPKDADEWSRFGLDAIGAESAHVWGGRFPARETKQPAPISDAQARMNADHEEAFREAARVGVRIVPPLR